MYKIKILSKILGSKYFAQLMIDDKAITQTLNAQDLEFNFEPNVKYLELKKNIEDIVLNTIERLQAPITSEDQIDAINDNLFYADENEDDKVDYLYKTQFGAIYSKLFKQIHIAKNFIAKESEFRAAVDLLQVKIKEYDCREHWLTKYLQLFEETIDDEAEQRYEYIKDYRYYSVTHMKILVSEDVFFYRQKFKSKYVELSKQLNSKYRGYYIEGFRYFDDY